MDWTFDPTSGQFPTVDLTDADIVALATQSLKPYKDAHTGKYHDRKDLIVEPGTGLLVTRESTDGARSLPWLGPSSK